MEGGEEKPGVEEEEYEEEEGEEYDDEEEEYEEYYEDDENGEYYEDEEYYAEEEEEGELVTVEDLTKDELKELRKMFDFFDEDKSGFVDEKELSAALRSYGADPSPEDVRNMMQEVDEDSSGAVDFNEFAQLLAPTVRGQKKFIDKALKDAFREFDANGDGDVDSSEMRTALTNLGLSTRNVDELVALADSTGDGLVDYEEFVAMVTDPEKAKENELFQTLADLLKPKPTDFLDAFGLMPSGFRPASLTKSLLSGEYNASKFILPYLGRNGISVANLNFNVEERQIAAVPALNAKISVIKASGIPLPVRSLDRVKGRLLRICLYNQKEKTILSNIHTVPATWDSRMEDQFLFSTKVLENPLILRTEYCKPICILFELSILIEQTGPKKKKKKKHNVKPVVNEISCGIGFLELPTLQVPGANNEVDVLSNIRDFHNKTIHVRLQGGTPDNPVEIDHLEITARRRGWRKLAKAFSGPPSPTISIHINSIGSGDRRRLSMMPMNLLIHPRAIPLIILYRESLLHFLGSSREGTTIPFVLGNIPRIVDPALSASPTFFDDSSMFLSFEAKWNESQRTFKRREKKDSNFVREQFLLLSRKFWAILKIDNVPKVDVSRLQESLLERKEYFDGALDDDAYYLMREGTEEVR